MVLEVAKETERGGREAWRQAKRERWWGREREGGERERERERERE